MSVTLIPGWYPPSPQNWKLIVDAFRFFPLWVPFQWLVNWYPQGKTSIESILNLPGKWAWLVMESPGQLSLLYCMATLPKQLGIGKLPWQNYAMAAMFTGHYVYRGWLSPLVLNPSMSPIHILVFLMAFAFNTINGLSFGGWLAGYGPTTADDWSGREWQFAVGALLWAGGLFGNAYHDEVLREIRRSASRRQQEQAEKEKKPVESVDKLYLLPEDGLFPIVLYPHYLCEWIEWAGFWLVGGWICIPARTFLLNEITTMSARAVQGKEWYVQKFGKEKVGDRKAVLPGIL